MKRIVVAVVALALAVPPAAVLAQPAPAAAPAAPTAVERWDTIGLSAFTATGQGPAEGHPIFAFTSLAVYDTVVALRGGYEPFAVRASAPRGASLDAAVAAAAHEVLVRHPPSQPRRPDPA